jgi:hypothetical protein
MLVLALCLGSELPPAGVHSNDFALHVSLAGGIERNRTLDFWHGTDLGYPVLRVYQPLYHLGLVTLDALTGFRLGLSWWATVSVFALAFALPLGVHLGVRRWLVAEGLAAGAAAWTAAVAALLAALSTSFTGFGFDPLQGLWTTYGVITQTWAMVFYAPAFAWVAAHVIGRERSPWPGAALCFVVCATSLIAGVMLAFTIALRGLIEVAIRKDLAPCYRLARTGALAVLLTASLWLPMVRDVPWVHYPARLFAPWVNEGFGQAAALKLLVGGRLLDGRSVDTLARPPVMTLLFAFGAWVCLRRWPGRGGAVWFLLGGFVLWFALFVGRQAWGGLLYALPLLRSYQWGRFETLLQFWAAVIAAIGVVWAWGAIARRRGGRRLAGGIALVLLVLLASTPAQRAWHNGASLRLARAGGAVGVVEGIAARVAGDPMRTYTGGPTTWEAEVKQDGVWLGVAIAAHGVPVAGRIFQGMDLASGMMYIWDGKSEWGGHLLGIGNWLHPCARSAELPILAPAVEVSPGVCLGIARTPPPLAFFSTLAASPPVTVAEGSVFDAQKEVLARAGQDVFLPFRLAAAGAAATLPARTAPLQALAATGHRFLEVAPGRAESQLDLEAPAAGAVAFPVPYHPRLEAWVDDVAVAPVPVLPGLAAVPVRPGRRKVVLAYVADRTKDGLFAAAVIAILVAIGARWRSAGQPALAASRSHD